LANHAIAASPFVVAMNVGNIKILPDIINASLLIFTLSGASSGKSVYPIPQKVAKYIVLIKLI
jgi:amino acid permease